MKIIPIHQWSPSKLKTFNECKFRFQLQYGQKIPEPERPLPPGKSEHANDRGTRIHESAEDFARGKGPFIPEMNKFRTEFDSLKTLFSNGMAEFEGEWAHDKNWNVVPWRSPSAWVRLKIDALVHLSPFEAVVIDYKGLPLDTPLPTPSGWTTMGTVKVGDQLLDHLGNVCNVVGKSTVKSLPCYRLAFDDTSEAVCDESHQWVLLNGEVKDVTDLRIGDFIPVAEPLQLPEASLVLDPYVLGIWLADGKHTSGEISKPDAFIWEEIQRRGFAVGEDYARNSSVKCETRTVYGLRTKLGELGLLGDKQIPANYLRASYSQRLDLLRGIMDGDGSANHTRKHAVINTTRFDFAEQLKELLLSLGQRPLLSPYMATGYGKKVQAYVVSFRPRGINPFSVPRKADKVLFSWGSGESGRRRIQKIEILPAQLTQCVAVDSADHTFLCTANFIPTHNSGRKFGNEIGHAEQTQAYQLVTLLRYPKLELVHTELWYLDLDEITQTTFSRQQGMRFKPSFERKGNAITNCTDFPANPNRFSCRFCPYSNRPATDRAPAGTGHCEKGVW